MTRVWRGTAGHYILFAVLATLLNFAAQSVSLKFLHGNKAFWISIGIGTVVGFFAKYILDKTFIFRDPRESITREVGKVILYGLTAVITTLIFWGAEWASWYIWHKSMAKYTSGALGITAGYILKYHLDKRFTFRADAHA